MSKESKFLKSTNPAMGAFKRMQPQAAVLDDFAVQQEEQMSIQGAINKSILLVLMMIASAAVAWLFPSSMLWYGGMFGAFAIALVISFKPTLAPTLAPIYAILEGLFLGSFSAAVAAASPFLVFQAVGLTSFTLLVMLLIYKFNIIPVTQKFRTAIVAATGAIMLMYLVAFIMSFFFGIPALYLHDGSWLAIGLSVVIIGVAAMNLLLDFDMIDKGASMGSPKYMEWYGAFALIMTLAWLYFEFLRLLSMLSSD